MPAARGRLHTADPKPPRRTAITTHAAPRHAVAVIDLGKTSCRLHVLDDPTQPTPLAEASGPGAPGLADADGAALAATAVTGVLDQLAPSTATTLASIVIGAAGATAAAHRAHELATLLAQGRGIPVAVCSDATIAHIGAFSGAAGTMLIVGTGAVACSLSPDGQWRQTDGWGPWLGDDGSGRWLGQQGLHAALRDYDGRGPHTSLRRAAEALAPALRDLPDWLSRGDAPARRLAEFAPTVIEHAAAGDAVAADIVTTATRLLAGTAAIGQAAGTKVAVIGGLAQHPFFAATLTAALATRGLTLVAPQGGPLDGGRLIAAHQAPLHEGQIVRVTPA